VVRAPFGAGDYSSGKSFVQQMQVEKASAMSRRRRAAAALLSLSVVLPATAAYAGSASDEAGDAGSGSAGVLAAQAAVRPHIAPEPAPVLQSVSRGLPADPAVVAGNVEDELSDDWLGDDAHVGVSVRDVATGAHLVDQNVDRGLIPASTTKLLAAAAIVTSLPMEEPFRTTVVTGEEPDQVVLVAGGDTLLATGAGDPAEVVGHAGLGDLVDQTVVGLRARGMGTEDNPLRVRLDTSYAAGPDRQPGWSDYWMEQGFTGPITMLGLAEDRAVPYRAAPGNPAQITAMAFREALRERGVEVGGGPRTKVADQVAQEDAEVLAQVESAPARDVLSEAMSSSDNALVEQLARQAAVAAGAGGDPGSVRDWVIDQVASYGIDMAGVKLADVSGLSGGSAIPTRVLADLLVVGADGSHPALQSVLGELPVAGYSGTLWDRFHLKSHDPAVGVARAKTGSLPGVTSLAGLVVTADGRLLAYAMIADEIGRDGAALEARSVLDTIVAELASCGC
jgi:D-alanyl-D-alanine carboxypeptidase/D-alanyl-D-alanine-endopeptidase (penicillin-binding protein 4)